MGARIGKSGSGSNLSPTTQRNSGRRLTLDKDKEKERRASSVAGPSPFASIDPSLAASLQEQTHFDRVEVSRLYDIYSALTNNGNTPIDKKQFIEGIEMLEEAGVRRDLKFNPFLERLFLMLDTDKDGKITLREFVSGLSLLCKGTPEEKLLLSFRAYDQKNIGFIGRDELAAMFRSAWMAGFKALLSSQGQEETVQTTDELTRWSSDMANMFADNAFETLDTNSAPSLDWRRLIHTEDGKLSFEEFKAFAMSEPKVTATLNGFKKEVPVTLV